MDNIFNNSLFSKFSTMFSIDLETRFRLNSNDDQFAEITKNMNQDYFKIGIKDDYHEQVFDPDPDHPIDYYRLLYLYKLSKTYSVDHILPTINNNENGKITRMRLGYAKVELAIPEDIQYIIVDNSAYIFANDSKTNTNKLSMELHGSKTINAYISIDYVEQHSYIVRNNEVIMDVSFDQFPNNIKEYYCVYRYYLQYQFSDNIITDILVEPQLHSYYYNGINQKNKLFSYRVDIVGDDEETVEKIIGIAPIPFIVTMDDIIIPDSDHYLYKTFIKEYEDDGSLGFEAEYYISYTYDEVDKVQEFWESIVHQDEN